MEQLDFSLSIKDFVNTRKIKLFEYFEHKKCQLAIIQVGNNPASNTYINGKKKDAQEINVKIKHFKYDHISEKAILKLIHKLNKNKKICGIIVQLPLPMNLNYDEIKEAINPEKDVDGFGKSALVWPCTPYGIYLYLRSCKFDFNNKNVVVLGRSDIVGKPMARLLLANHANVTVLHSHTSESNKKMFLSKADLIIVATGRINTLTKEYIFKKNAVVIDVGINRDENNKLIGDCEKDLPVKFQSPVPGGVGLLTRLSIFENLKTLIEYKDRKN